LRIAYNVSLLLLVLLLALGFIFSFTVPLPGLWLIMFVVFGIIGIYHDRSNKLAWFFPSVVALCLTWWRYVCDHLLPYIASLNYASVGVYDVAGQVLRARVAFMVIPLLLLVVYCYFARAGIKELMLIPTDMSILSLPAPLTLVADRLMSLVGDKLNLGDSMRQAIAAESRLIRAGFRSPSEDIVICYTKSGEPVRLSDQDRYLHTLVVGPTGAGKTSSVLKPMIEQEIRNIRSSMVRNIPRGITVIEPKGDLASDVAQMSRYYNVPLIHIDPLSESSSCFNPLDGDPPIVSEATKTVLSAMFGRQEGFFKAVQEMAARNVVLLLKYRHGDNVTMQHVNRLLSDVSVLQEEVNGLRELMTELGRQMERAESTGDERRLLWLRYLHEQRMTIAQLISYFDTEVLSGQMAEKHHQFALGLRLQIGELAGNEFLGPIIGGRSDVNLDVHLEHGGILVVNTAMGVLGKAGDAFGQFLVMHFQNAVFRRSGDEFSRSRHMLVMDEAHRYINPDFERLLAMGRSYRCECVLALQNTSQLLLEEKRSFRDTVLNSCRNKIVFGGMDSVEAEYFSAEFGEYLTERRQVQYDASMLYGKPWSGRKYRIEPEFLKKRFDYTDLMELPAFHVVYSLVSENRLLPPGVGITRRSDWDMRSADEKSKVEVGIQTRSDNDEGDDLFSEHITTTDVTL
jgi:hypothetical protein